MKKIFIIISKHNLLITEQLKELSSNYIKITLDDSLKNLFNYFQRNYHLSLINPFPLQDIVLENIENLKLTDLKRIIAIIKNSKNRFFLVAKNESPNLISLFKKNGIDYELIRLNLPKGKEEVTFIINLLKKKKIELPPQIIGFFIKNYHGNLEILIQDLKKISVLGKDEISKNLRFLVNLLTDSFKIEELFLNRNWPEFIHHFKKLILEDRSQNHFKTIGMLSFLSKSLIKIYLLKNKRVIEGHQFYLKKLQQKSETLTLTEIKKLHSALTKTEKKIKKYLLPFEDIPEDIYINYLLST